jgi:hypothetical protein
MLIRSELYNDIACSLQHLGARQFSNKNRQ